jgi:hypothetical protein
MRNSKYARKGFQIYEEMCKYFTIYDEAVSHICLCNCSILNFLIYEENLIFFFIDFLFYRCTSYISGKIPYLFEICSLSTVLRCKIMCYIPVPLGYSLFLSLENKKLRINLNCFRDHITSK